MRRKILIIAFVLIFTISIVPTYGTEEIQVALNGDYIVFTLNSGMPFIDASNRTQVPFRQSLEEIGAKVNWDQKNRAAIAEKNGIVVIVPIGADYIYKNGEKIPNDTVALIKDGRTYLPIRVVFEAFGCSVNWETSKKLVEVNSDIGTSQIKVSSEYLKLAIPALKKKIIFENDIRVFTLFAFMNFTGYDDNNGRVITGVRKDMREELDALGINISNHNYFTSKNLYSGHYVQALNYIGGAPDFRYVRSLPSYLSSLNDLPEKLEEFYRDTNMEDLYAKYNSKYMDILKQYQQESLIAIAKINYYLKIDNNNVETFGVVVNLLDAYNRGSGLGSDNYYKGYNQIITGPSDTINIRNVVHEYLHGILNPLVNSNTVSVNKLSFLMPNDAMPTGYSNWESIFEESIVRALSDMPLNGVDPKYMAQYETNQGFVLTSYFYDRFGEFGVYNGTLDGFLKKIVEEYQ